MDWTKRINVLVGQDFYIHKNSEDPGVVKNFIDWLYRPYEKSDVLLDSMEEVDTDIFFKYRRPLYDIAYYTGAKKIVECGIREGRSSDAFTRVVSKRGGKVYSFDPVLLPETFVKPPFTDYWEPHEMTGEDGSRIFGWVNDNEDHINMIDLLYIDVDPHHLEDSRRFIKIDAYWMNNLKKGGFLVLDDICPQHDASVGSLDYSSVWRVVRDYGVLRSSLEMLDRDYDNIDYFFTVFNNQANGFAVIKLK